MPNTEPFTIASAAKSLIELKQLPLSVQATALLKRLAQIFPQVQGAGGLHKGNLLLPTDKSLSMGFAETEEMQVRLHLLGSPWSRLMHDGYLIDPTGSGFYAISEEGYASLESSTNLQPEVTAVSPHAHTHTGRSAPRVFISYSWESTPHKEWVYRLARRLRKDGIDIILDRWDLRLGDDKAKFMEASIAKAQLVLVICTSEYARKSNDRHGGVGYEAMILTSQLAQHIDQRRFIPILRAGEWPTSSPIWIQAKLGSDLRNDPYSEVEYDALLRDLHEELPERPAVGPRPDFTARNPDVGSGVVVASTNAVSTSVEARKPSKVAPKVYDRTIGKPPILLGQFREESGMIPKTYENEEDDLPSLGMELWIENAPSATLQVFFEITDRSVDNREWSLKRKKASRMFLTDDVDLWGNVGIFVRGMLSDDEDWTIKTTLYDTLKRYYGTGQQSEEIEAALKQIRDN